jgi:lysozyme-related protein Hpa2
MLTTISRLASRARLPRPIDCQTIGTLPGHRADPAQERRGTLSRTVRVSTVTTVPVRTLKPVCSALVAVAGMLPIAAAAATDCFLAAAAYQHVDPLLLRAIAWQESHANVTAVHRNRNGSVDYGIMQINSIHLPTLSRYGIDRNLLMDPCVNVYIAAWILHGMILRYGNTWEAVGAYHSQTLAERDRYAHAIAALIGQPETPPRFDDTRP